MPVCTSCTHPTPYLYTVYGTPNNIRLEKCTACNEFVDPYVEHDAFTIVLDLILLKRGVYRHLIFNSGAVPREVGGKGKSRSTQSKGELKKGRFGKRDPDRDRWAALFQLGISLVAVDAFIRWSYLNPTARTQIEPWRREDANSLLRFFLGTATETLAFHGGISLACFVVLHVLRRFRPSHPSFRDEFRLPMIPLSLFYSSITKLFLSLLLTIWAPNTNTNATHGPLIPSSPISTSTSTTLVTMATTFVSIPALASTPTSISHTLWQPTFTPFTPFDITSDKLDREWIIRNVLGGMSAGFGLRVILPLPAPLASLIILIGWSAKNWSARLVAEWVGGSLGWDGLTSGGGTARRVGEAWLAYSVP